VAEAHGLEWQKNHFKKAKLATALFNDKILSIDVSNTILELNNLRRDVSYGEPGDELVGADLESIVGDLETCIGEVADLVKLTESDCAAVLIGSAARGCRTEHSDIDILLICTKKIGTLPIIPGYHIKFGTEVDFMRRLAAGEDFEAWCIRLGVTLVDRGVWSRIKAASGEVWPRWESKVVHGIRRLFLASQLSGGGDMFAAKEELVFVLGHIARALLLRVGTFPLSRPELADQIRALGYVHLADLHERLRICDKPSRKDVSLGLLYSKKLLVYLDRSMYGKIAQDYAKIARVKELVRMQRNGFPGGKQREPI
jgi:predicted nucleotidyltransferase